MSVFHNNALIGAGGGAAAAADFQIDRSLRFHQSDSANLSRTFSSSGNRKTWTLSWWMKLGKLGNNRGLFGMPGTSSGSPQFFTRINTDDRIYVYEYNTSGTYQFIKETDMRLRDPSAWYHCVFQFDSTQSTAEDGFKIYINGTRVTTWVTNNLTNYAQNYDGAWNSNANTGVHKIGLCDQYFDGYMAEIYFIDGSALAATDFGEYDDNNVWQPKQHSGTYGTNGFKLDFSDNSSSSALGTDSSGNSNTFTVNNLTATARNYTSEGSTSGSFYDSAGGAASKMFDGSASTGAFSQSGTATFTFGGSTITASTSLKVRAFKGDASGANVLVNGTDISSLLNSQSGGGYSTVNITSTLGGAPINLSNVSVVNASGGSGNIAQIFVDDVELIDANASDIDSLIDTPTNYTASSGNNGGNYATINPLQTQNYNTGSVVISNGNLEIDTSGIGWSSAAGTIAVSSGKWYWEYTCSNLTGSELIRNGIFKQGGVLDGTGGDQFTSPDVYNYASNAQKWTGSAFTSYGATYTTGDVIGVALDLDAGTLTFYKNGSSQGSAYTGLSGTFSPYFAQSSDPKSLVNFGARPFAHTPPSNHLALVTTNLSDPTIADPSTAFDAVTYTGSASGGTFDIPNFNPSFIWSKNRADITNHVLADSVRGYGNNKNLFSNTTSSEAGNNNIMGVSGNTVTYGTNGNFTGSMVSWAWDAGSSTVSNTDGNITTNVRASQTNGFSIATYTGNGSANQTLGHGLGAAPAFVIIKDRSSSQNWAVLHTSAGTLGTLDGGTNYKLLELSSTAAARDASYNTIWHPTNTTVKIGEGASSAHWTNKSGDNYVMYAWAPVEGFSSFGSYEGNGSSDGPFIFTGMRPSWLLLKESSSSGELWTLYDSARNTFNVAGKQLYPSLSSAEADASADTHARVDFLSNGFKIRGSHSSINTSGETIVYAAFAEHPFKTARAR